MRHVIAFASLALSSMLRAQPTLVNESASGQWLGGTEYNFTVTTRVTGFDVHSLTQVHLILANSGPFDGFGCHLVAGPAARVMYLADDLTDWGPNERDRYVNDRFLRPQSVQNNGVHDPSHAPDPLIPDWPNNSQCTLKSEGSVFNFLGSDRIQVTFRVSLKPHVHGQFYMSVSSLYLSDQHYWSNFDNFGAFLIRTSNPQTTNVPNFAPEVLGMGFESKTSAIGVTPASGHREVFYFRFKDPNGISQVGLFWVKFSPFSGPNAGGNDSMCIVQAGLFSASLFNDNGTGFVSQNGVAFGSPSFEGNTRCRIHGGGSRFQFLSPTEGLLRLEVEFLSWPGLRYIHRAAYDWEAPTAGPGGWYANPDSATYTVQAPSGGGLSLSQFRQCVSATPGGLGNDCKLAAGEHELDGTSQPTILIQRSGITVRGDSRFTTIIRRRRTSPTFGPGSMTGSLMAIDTSGASLNDIVIRDLTFDGNRAGGESYQWGQSPGVSEDLQIVNVNGSTASLPVVVERCRFVRAAERAIASHPPIHFQAFGNAVPAKPTQGIIIRYNEFRRSLRAPVHIGLGGTWWPAMPPTPPTAPDNPPGTPPQSLQQNIIGSCDLAAGARTALAPPAAPGWSYPGLPAANVVSDVRVHNNFFEQNDTGAFGIDSTKGVSGMQYGVQIYDNAMLDNYDNGYDCGGGVIAILSCGKNVNVERNFLWNRNVSKEAEFCYIPVVCPGPGCPSANPNAPGERFVPANALELWGTDINVSNNRIEYFPAEGIFAAAVQRLTITGNLIRNTSRGLQNRPELQLIRQDFEYDAAGVRISTASVVTATRPVVTVTLTGNEIGNQWTSFAGPVSSIQQSYGVRLGRDASSGDAGGQMTGVTILNNEFLKNRLGHVCHTNLTLPAFNGQQPAMCFSLNGEGVIGNPVGCGTGGCP